MTPVDYHPPVKRSIEIAGHKTSVSLEPLFWDMLQAAARDGALPLNALVARIDADRLRAPAPTGLAGAIRLWVTAHAIGRVGGQAGGHAGRDADRGETGDQPTGDA